VIPSHNPDAQRRVKLDQHITKARIVDVMLIESPVMTIKSGARLPRVESIYALAAQAIGMNVGKWAT